jgi:hypothetical protein
MLINEIKKGMTLQIDDICAKTLERYDINDIMRSSLIGKEAKVTQVVPQDERIGAVFFGEFVIASEDVSVEMKMVEKPATVVKKFDINELF